MTDDFESDPDIADRAHRVDREAEIGEKCQPTARVKSDGGDVQDDQWREGDGNQMVTRDLLLERRVDQRWFYAEDRSVTEQRTHSAMQAFVQQKHDQNGGRQSRKKLQPPSKVQGKKGVADADRDADPDAVENGLLAWKDVSLDSNPPVVRRGSLTRHFGPFVHVHVPRLIDHDSQPRTSRSADSARFNLTQPERSSRRS